MLIFFVFGWAIKIEEDRMVNTANNNPFINANELNCFSKKCCCEYNNYLQQPTYFENAL